MKKLFMLIILVVLVVVLYNPLKNMISKEGTKEPEKFIYEDLLNITKNNSVNVSDFTIYGKWLNLKGSLPGGGNYTIVLKNNDTEVAIDTKVNDGNFSLASKLNEGLDLETLKVGEYLVLLKNTDTNEYYNLINNTKYHDNTYYTITKNGKNNKITFKESVFNDIKYWTINIKEEKLPSDVYDVVIDPGHGGVDTGAGNGSYHESAFTLDYSKTLYDELTKAGLKVKLTRETDTNIDHYGVGSRTGIPYETKAKLMLSIHLNSSGNSYQKGVEIYRAYNSNNDYAKLIADNIVKEVGTKYSNNSENKIIDGVYMRVYSKSDIQSLTNDAKKKNYEPYVINDHTTYYYFIRETGGIMTGAFSDGRNPRYKENPYRDYNQGVEAYLCELAYISQNDDLSLVRNKKDNYVKALKNSIISYFNNETTSE